MEKTRDRTAHRDRREPISGEAERASRQDADAERQDDGMELSQEERDQMLRDGALQDYLPRPPDRKGIHWFWGATTMEGPGNIAYYKRLGYELVRLTDPLIKGWAEANRREASGQYADYVTVNEMVLMKISEALYQRYMRILHHEKPNQEAQRVKDMLDEMKSQVGNANLREVAGPGETNGFTELDRQTKVRDPGKFD